MTRTFGVKKMVSRKIGDIFCILVLLMAIVYIGAYFGNNIQKTFFEASEYDLAKISSIAIRTDTLQPLPGEKTSDRWIVVTSIQPPTDDIKLLGQLEKYGWRTLVVGDKSTPPNWVAPSGVRLLTHAEATSLGYNLLAYQRWKTYSIKNIGYLFAIQHGAKIIYDTDDDNHPTDGLKSMLSLAGYLSNGTKQDSLRGLVWNPEPIGDSDIAAINTLPHFGQSSLWPRGFPLTEVARPALRNYVICTTRSPVWIQGVVNGDPDMDAIFRLTRKHVSTPINLTFDHAPPVVVPQHFFVQSNSQNTLFTEEALPLLFFPPSPAIAMRETDIWRAYIGQALLWLVGGRKGYVSPNAFQARNPHNYLLDFNEEIKLYKHAGELISYLAKWQCAPQHDFGQCFIQIYEDLAERQLIITPLDVEAAKAWISDLRRLIDFPQRRSDVEDCLGDRREMQFYPVEQPLSMPAISSLGRVLSVQQLSANSNCSNLQTTFNPLLGPDQVVFVIFISQTETFKPSISLLTERLDLLYRPYFARRIFCLPTSFDYSQVRTTVIPANSGTDCLQQVIDLRLHPEIFVLLTIDKRFALLSPEGVQITAATLKKTEMLVGACGQSGPSVAIVTSSNLQRSSSNDYLVKLCDNHAHNTLTASTTCSLSPNCSILLNCQKSLMAAEWMPPF